MPKASEKTTESPSSGKTRALESAIEQIEKSFGRGSIMKLGESIASHAGRVAGGNFGQVIGTTVLFSGSILGPILILFMLAAAYKAPSLLEEGLGLNKPRGKK